MESNACLQSARPQLLFLSDTNKSNIVNFGLSLGRQASILGLAGNKWRCLAAACSLCPLLVSAMQIRHCHLLLFAPLLLFTVPPPAAAAADIEEGKRAESYDYDYYPYYQFMQ